MFCLNIEMTATPLIFLEMILRIVQVDYLITGRWIWEDYDMTVRWLRKYCEMTKQQLLDNCSRLTIVHLNNLSIIVHSFIMRWLRWDDCKITLRLLWHELRDEIEITDLI